MTETTNNPYFGEVELEPVDDFEDSIWDKLGYSRQICPECGSHLRNDICLNTCHLSDTQRQEFRQLIDGDRGDGGG